MDWAVAASLPQLEHKALKDLTSLGFPCYSPKASLPSKRGRGRVVASLFPGYLFFKTNAGVDPADAFRARHVVDFLRRGDSLAIVGDWEVSAIRRRESSDGLIYIHPTGSRRFQRNQRVRAKAGPFVGFDGVVDSCASERVRVLFDIFGRHTPVTLGHEDLTSAA
jgi:transcription antitermination factor NusG